MALSGLGGVGAAAAQAPADGGPVPPDAVHATDAAPAFSMVELLGETLDAEWALPPDTLHVQGLVLLQHGFARRCAHLRPLAARLAGGGFASFCLNADMARGHPQLAGAWAEWLLRERRGGRLPDGRPWPDRWIVAGHSAGAAFAMNLGRAITARSTGPVVGALLLDPVPGIGFDQALRELGAPVVAVLAAPGPCNAQGQAGVPLEAAKAAGAAVQVQRIPGGTHLDAEGEATEALAVWACRQGVPRADAIEATRQAAEAAARAMLPATGAQPACRKGPAAASSACGASSAM